MSWRARSLSRSLRPDGVAVDSLSPFPFVASGGRTVVSLGALVAEQVVEVVLRLNFPYGELGRESGAVLSLSARDDVVDDGGSVALSWQYADSVTNDAQPRDVEVDRVVAACSRPEHARRRCRSNRTGDYAGARTALAGVAKRIRTYAGRDAEMRSLVGELESRVAEVAAPMPEAARARRCSSRQ